MRLASYSPSWNDGAVFLERGPELRRSPALAAVEDEVRQQVRLVMLPSRPERALPERRRSSRTPFPHPVHLTPVDPQGRPLVDATIVVIGRNLSEMGFDFYHTLPLPHRRVIATFEVNNGGKIGLLLDLSWCRFGRHGFYDGGGKFLSAIASPL